MVDLPSIAFRDCTTHASRLTKMPQYGIPIQLVLTLVALLGVGCRDLNRSLTEPSRSDSGGGGEVSDEQPISEQRLAFVNRVRPRVEKFCSDCHAMPRPASSPRDEWTDEVNQGFTLYGESGRNDLEVPPYDEVLKFFEYQAPAKLSCPRSIIGYQPTPVRLRAATVRLPGSRPPVITNVRWLDIGLEDSPALVYCDIGSGAVKAHWPMAEGAPTRRLATLLQPVHSESCDLDNDGHTDLVVADIGEFDANDSDLGRVVWLRRKPDSEKFETIVVQEGLSRVADVQPGDFDGDGDLDLLVGVFGWRKTGRIVLLENLGAAEGERTQFQLREIDDRNGPSHVPPVDLNGDGHLDFVALVSQEHEVVEAFINDGSAQFEKQLIWAAPDPAYGSSGIQLVDLDSDGDQDILYTNGDSFDRGAKPHHSVQWLENTGDFPYQHHELCRMPGVLSAKAADFDGDGDLDVIAASLLAGGDNLGMRSADTSSVVMLIQEKPERFRPFQVEGNTHNHCSLETGDFNKDGKIDFAVGNFLRSGSADQPDLVVWWNES